MVVVALYVGAGTDTRPLTRLTHINRFIFVDGEPGSAYYTYGGPNFISALDEAMWGAGFSLQRCRGGGRSNVRVYHGAKGRLVEYHTNTVIPKDAAGLPEKACSVLVVAGHDPHSEIVDHCCPYDGLTLVGFEETALCS